VLRRHCDAVGRDYDDIEKTAIFPMDPATTTDDIVRMVEELRPQGFAAAYIYAHDITDRASIIDRLGAAAPRLA